MARENAMDGAERMDVVRSHTKVALLAQLAAYVVLVLAAVAPFVLGMDGMPAMVAAVTVMLVLMHAFWPFRAGQAVRWISLLFGIASALFAFSPLAELIGLDRQRAAGAEGQSGMVEYQWVTWAVAAGGLLIVLTIVCFGRQMARADRSHLIRALSHSVTSGTAAIAAPGWCFLPWLISLAAYASTGELSSTGTVAVWVAVAIVVVLAAALSFASVFWLRDADPAPEAHLPWLGLALLPVMLLGAVIAAVMLVLTPFVF